jgi:hypothetical protein
VPAIVMSQLALDIQPNLRKSDQEARAALRSIYELYDYWDWQVEIHARAMQRARLLMLTLLLGGLTGAVFLLYARHIYSGITLGGLAGALLSVLAKPPGVMSMDENYRYNQRIIGRVAVGVAASMIGIGLLSADLISIKLPDGQGNVTIAEMIDSNDHVLADKAKPVKPDKPDAPGPGATSGMQVEPPPAKVPHFPTRNVLVLLALTMLFGFSERALSTFEDRIFPTVGVDEIMKRTTPPQKTEG